jgi:multiple sugar transport system permease protein
MPSRPTRRLRAGGLWRPLVALAVVALFLGPLALMVSTSLRETGRPLSRRLEWLPRPLAWENYPAVFDLLDLWRFAANSVFVVALAVPLTIVVASWAGFAMAQLPQVWRLRLTLLSFATLMVPLTAVWLTRFLLFKEAGLLDSRLALVVPALGGTSPVYALFFLWTFLRVPAELYEAARLDGAGALRIWAGIAMPLARPTIVAVGMIAFIHYWSNFIDPLLYLQSTEKQTLPYALELLHQLDSTNWPLLMAGAVLVTAPVVLVFVLGQRHFLQQFRGEGWVGR